MFVATASTPPDSKRARRASRVDSAISRIVARCPSMRRAAAQNPPARTAQDERETRSPEPSHFSPADVKASGSRPRVACPCGRDQVARPPPAESSPKGEPVSSEATSRPLKPTYSDTYDPPGPNLTSGVGAIVAISASQLPAVAGGRQPLRPPPYLVRCRSGPNSKVLARTGVDARPSYLCSVRYPTILQKSIRIFGKESGMGVRWADVGKVGRRRG